MSGDNIKVRLPSGAYMTKSEMADPSESSFAAPTGSVSSWRNQVVALEIKTDRLREAAYKSGCYGLASDLQEVMRALRKIRSNKIPTPNDKADE